MIYGNQNLPRTLFNFNVLIAVSEHGQPVLSDCVRWCSEYIGVGTNKWYYAYIPGSPTHLTYAYKGEFYQYSFYFANEDDAVMFKLVFG